MPEDVFRWIVAIGVALGCVAFLVQAGLVFAVYRIARKTQQKISPLVDEAQPILSSTRQILAENGPRLAEMSKEALAMSKSAREQTERAGELFKDVSSRLRERVAQLDQAVDEAVAQLEHASGAMRNAVTKPVREMAGVLQGMKAAVVTYAQGGRRPSVDHATQDEEMFI